MAGVVWTKGQLRGKGYDLKGDKVHIPKYQGSGIWIPGNVPSSKNSRNIGVGKHGKIFNTPSNLTKEYEKTTMSHFQKNKRRWFELIDGMPFPIKVIMLFTRSSKRKCDHHNLVQIVADLMSEPVYRDGKLIKFGHGYIEDDSDDILLIYPPIEPPYKKFSKLNPGVEIIPFR